MLAVFKQPFNGRKLIQNSLFGVLLVSIISLPLKIAMQQLIVERPIIEGIKQLYAKQC